MSQDRLRSVQFALLAVSVVFFLAGCTTYQPTAEPGVWTRHDAAAAPTLDDGADTSAAQISPAFIPPAPYTLRSGDSLDVTINHLTPIQEQGLVVNDEGEIELPLAGIIRVGGATQAQVRKMIEAAFKPIFPDAGITLRLRRRRPAACYVLGQVKNPGRHSIEGGARLVEIIADAGGFRYLDRRDALGASDLGRAYVARNNGLVRVDFKALFERGDMRENIEVADGDLIFVPDNTHREVVVLGSVNKAGVVPMANGDLNVLTAIGHAGGFSQYADISTVAVVRNIESQPVVTLVRVDNILDGREQALRLENGDVIYVAQDDIKALDLPGIAKTAASGFVIAMGAAAVTNNN